MQVRDSIFILEKNSVLYLPAEEILNALDIFVLSSENGFKIQGWFLSENRKFSFDAIKKEALFDGNKFPLLETDYLVDQGAVFIAQNKMSEIWPLVFSLDRKNSSLTVFPNEKLPLQLKLERESRRGSKILKNSSSHNYPLIENPYEAGSFPSVDSAFNATTQERQNTISSYSFLAAGDLAYMGMDAFIAGDTSINKIREARLTLGRESNEGHVFGIKPLTQFRVGDVTLPGVNLLSNPRYERGVQISTAPINFRNEFDRTMIEGEAQPGQEVELWRGDEYLDYQIVGANGRYAFVDVPVLVGLNNLRVVIYGSQGQKREVAHNFRIEDGLMRKHQNAIRLFATDTGYSMGDYFGVKLPDQPDAHQTSYLAQYNYGLTQNLTAEIFATRLPTRQTLQSNSTSNSLLAFRPLITPSTEEIFAKAQTTDMTNYKGAGLKMSLWNSFWRLDHMADDSNGQARELSVVTGIPLLTFSAAQASYDNLASAVSIQNNDLLRERSRGRLSSSIPIPGLSQKIDIDLQAEKRRGVLGLIDDRGLLRLSTRVNRIRLVNALLLNWVKLPDQSTSTQRQGDFEASTRVESYELTGGVTYNTQEEISATDYRALVATEKFLSSRFEVGWQKQLLQEDQAFAIGWSKNFFDYRAGLQTKWSQVNGVTAFATLNISFGQTLASKDIYTSSESLATTGIIEPHFIFQEKEIKDPEVLINTQQRNMKSDRPHPHIVRGLPTNEKMDVTVNKSSLEDPFWSPEIAGYSVIPRRGKVVPVYFNIIETGEIEGQIYVEGKPVSDIKLSLVDSNGTSYGISRSGFDGTFYWNLLKPGTYTIQLAAEQSRRWQKIKLSPLTVEVSKEELGIFGLRIDAAL